MRWIHQASVLALTAALCLTAGYFLHDFLKDMRCDIASSIPDVPQHTPRRPSTSRETGPPAWMPASGHTRWYISVAPDTPRGRLTLEDPGSGNDNQIDIWAVHVSPAMAVNTVTLHSNHRHHIELPSGRYRIRIRKWERPGPGTEGELSDTRTADQPEHVQELGQIRIQKDQQSSLLLYAGRGFYLTPPKPVQDGQNMPVEADSSTTADERMTDSTNSSQEAGQ